MPYTCISKTYAFQVKFGTCIIRNAVLFGGDP